MRGSHDTFLTQMDDSDVFETLAPVISSLPVSVLWTSKLSKSEISMPLPYRNFSGSLLCTWGLNLDLLSIDLMAIDYLSKMRRSRSSLLLCALLLLSERENFNIPDLPFSLIRRQLWYPLQLALSSQTLEDFPNSKGFDLCFSSATSTPLGLSCALKDVVPPKLLGF